MRRKQEKQRQRRGEFRRVRESVQEEIVSCWEKRLDRREQFEEAKRVMHRKVTEIEERRTKEQKEGEIQSNKSQILRWIEKVEEHWDHTLRRCAERRTSPFEGARDPDAQFGLYPKYEGIMRDELEEWTWYILDERWYAWEDRNYDEMRRIEKLVKLMAERRQEVKTEILRVSKAKKRKINEMIEESISAKGNRRENEKKQIEEDPQRRESSSTRWERNRAWQRLGNADLEEKATRRRTNAREQNTWGQKRKKTMERWEAPPPGPPR